MSDSALIVVTHANWVSEDFAPVAGLCDIIKDYGFDIPDALQLYSDVSWWMPTAHAARLQRVGVATNLISPGPAWMDSVPFELSQRKIRTESLSDFLSRDYDSDQKFFIKPAEIKHDGFPANFLTVADVAGIQSKEQFPGGMMVQYTDRLISINHEYRLHILDGVPVTVSPYLVDNVTYYDGANGSLVREAMDYAAYAVKRIKQQPAAYVLDVAIDMDTGNWFVLEGNPAWSSAIYGCDPVYSYYTIKRSCQTFSSDAHFLWKPDIYLKEKAELKVPLK